VSFAPSNTTDVRDFESALAVPSGNAESGYVTVNTISIYRPFLALMRRANPSFLVIRHVLISRWSREYDDANAAEQASKVLDLHRGAVSAIDEMERLVPEVAWRTDEGRARHNIVAVQVRDVTPHRYADDPFGTTIVGYLIVVRDAVVFRVSSSGFKTIAKEDGDELNVYCQAVIELLKYSAAHGGKEHICLRLSDDPTRKGRLAVELARLDRWIQRLGIRIFLGAQEFNAEGFGKLIQDYQNANSENDRLGKVTSLTGGRVAAFDKNYLPLGIVNLPPYLGHVENPDLPGFDKRVRNETHIVTAWTPEVFPALAEYVAAFARNAGRAELVEILRRHKVPTPRQLPPRNGKAQYSSLRDTTFDQLPIDEATRRAERWMTYSDKQVRPVPPDATAEEVADTERDNCLAIRKFEMLRAGEYMFQHRNPTPTVDKYGNHEVQRAGLLDPGAIRGSIKMDWPHKRKVVERDGVLVVSAELELDDDGNPVPWVHAGVSLAHIDDCINRLRRKAEQGPEPRPARPTSGWLRLLRFNRWATTDDGDEARQWEMLPIGQQQSDRAWKARWLIWRPAPDQNEPLADLNLSWKVHEVNARTKRENATWLDRHVGTVREEILVRWAAEALQEAALTALDTQSILSSPDFGQRSRETADRRNKLMDKIATAHERAIQARKAANGYEDTAMIDHNDGNLKEAARKTTRADEKRAEADALDADAARVESELAGLDTTADADLPITTLARLLEAMRRAADKHNGLAPAEIARITQRMFVDWKVSVEKLGLRVTCTARLPLADGSVVELPLDGVVPNTAYRQSTKEPFARIVLQGLLEGRSFDEVASSGSRGTSRAALYIQARKLLTEAGVSTYRTQPLLDHPFGIALQSVWAGLTNERPEQQMWTPAFEQHMRWTYANGNWAKAACPTTHMSAIHRVFAVIRQRPGGIPIHDVAVAAGVNQAFVRRLVTPVSAGQGAHRQWPKLLEWVPDRSGDEVRAFPCPHADCPSPANNRWATDAAMFPETCPVPGEVGGVLCPSCSRLPRLDYGHVPFPAMWHEPVARLTDGNKGSLRTTSLTGRIKVGPVAKVSEAKPAALKIDELASEVGVGRGVIVEILSHYGVNPTLVRGRGSGKRGRSFYDAADARKAISTAFGPNGEWDHIALSTTALRISAAAQRADVTIATIQDAVKTGTLGAHFTRNGHFRFQPDTIDAWVVARSETSKQLADAVEPAPE
jgi:hypothetical protein